MRTARLASAAALLMATLPAIPAQADTAALIDTRTLAALESPFEGDGLVSDDTLMWIAGKADINQEAVATNTGVVAGNTVGDNAVTGNVVIDNNAFQNLNGLSILSINTGNNVALNAAMNVNISLTAGQ